MNDGLRVRLVRRILFASALFAAVIAPAPSRADDGYDADFARAVRAATEVYRLELWARGDDYIQSTDYIAHVGVMLTNHERFSPPDLAHPTVLIYDLAGRLVACQYQFLDGSALPSAFKAVPAEAWFDIPRHVHYNIRIGNQIYYAQADWPTTDLPTADNLRRRKLMPDDGTLLFAFIHPKTRAFLVWAWLPNVDGLFSGENALLP